MAIEESRNVFYKEWVDGGYLIKTNGNALNYDLIESDLEQTAKPFVVESAHYDSWNAQEFAQNMTKKKFNMLDFRMNTSNLSEPMKKLDSAILEGNVVHDGNECTTWCMSNVVAKRDHNDNVFPRKEHESMKIDPAVAIIMAIAGWVNEENEQSVYEERGMIFI